MCQSDGPTHLDITRYRVSGLTTSAVKMGDSKIAANASNPDDKVARPLKSRLHWRRSKFHTLHSKSPSLNSHDVA